MDAMAFPDRHPVDTGREPSVSFAPPAPPQTAEGRDRREPVPDGPRRTAGDSPPPMSRVHRKDVSGYPVQLAKVQRPSLRDETLARDRLLDWLHVKIHHRAVFVIAEAGYGKTTLLADFSRRTRMRTLWYRLGDEDRNWIAFVSYLVAAGREVDASFAPATADLLRDLKTAGPSMDTVVETFVREFQVLGDEGAVVVLDDYHIVDDAPEIRTIVRQLFARAPERVTFVVASRRQPSLPVARLRALGEIADLTTDDLRFNRPETERLFRETYGRPLEPDVLADLSRRTEGWAASLQLVQAAIRGRSTVEIRSFVRSLSGAEGELYDYLAEEVIGSLPLDEQSFVMRCAVLETVEPRLAAVAADMDQAEAARYIDKAVKAGLLGRPTRRGAGSRYHPLVQQFLLERLHRDAGPAAVASLNRRVADSSPGDWRVAARHYARAGDRGAVVQTIAAHLAGIVSEGAYEEATRVFPARVEERPVELQILLSRMDVQSGRLDHAATRAGDALNATEHGSARRDLALANLMSIAVNAGDGDLARELATLLEAETSDPSLRAIGAATLRLIDSSLDGDIRELRAELETMAASQIANGELHYYGVTMLNIAECHRHEGQLAQAFDAASEAIDALERTSAGMELATAYSVRAWATAHLRGVEAAAADMAAAVAVQPAIWRLQTTSEVADINGFYGDPNHAAHLLQEARPPSLPPAVERPLLLTLARVLMTVGRHAEAASVVDSVSMAGPNATPAFELSVLTTRALIAAASDSPTAGSVAEQAIDLAVRQGAGLWLNLALIAHATAGPAGSLDSRLRALLKSDPAYASMAADLITPRLHMLSEDVYEGVSAEMRFRPSRWRPALRAVVSGFYDSGLIERAVPLLEDVGQPEDIAVLRAVAKRHRRASALAGAGRRLIRRLAPRVFVEDLGRVTVVVGDRLIHGTSVRRKAAALLCFLLTQKDLSAARDQVIDALWPELDPSLGLNSLNQTLYFLRRVFEPAYHEDTSPGYVHHESEVIWLDESLVDSRSNACRRLIRALPADPEPDSVDRLTHLYRGRFALDFEYEEWAAEYRDWLHSSFLETVERAVQKDTGTGHYGRGIRLAQRALEVDPHAEQIEVSLLRLYRLSGAHAAAAEQYLHYSRAMRESLGVDPPTLESL